MTEVIMNQERDKFLTELMTCKHDWHKPYEYIEAYECRICKQTILDAPDVYIALITSFSTPEGFFKLWNWAQEHDWWDNYDDSFLGVHNPTDINYFNVCAIGLINPDRFANSVYEFLKNFDN